MVESLTHYIGSDIYSVLYSADLAYNKFREYMDGRVVCVSCKSMVVLNDCGAIALHGCITYQSSFHCKCAEVVSNVDAEFVCLCNDVGYARAIYDGAMLLENAPAKWLLKQRMDYAKEDA